MTDSTSADGTSADTGSAPRRHASAFVISITPFDESGAFDESALRAHLARLADSGIGVYVGGGGSGEGYTLSPSEVIRLNEIAVEELGNRVPVRSMGVEPRTAVEMVAFIKSVTSIGVDAAQVYSLDVGHGHRPTVAAVERYLRDVLDSVDISCIVSSHQSVGYRIEPELIGRLLDEYPHLTGVNSSHQDLQYLADLVDVTRGRAELHVGGEAQALTALALGATGFMSSSANLAPRTAVAVIDAVRVGDLDGCFARYDVLNRLASLLYRNGGIRATKAVLGEFGLPGGFPRLPHLPIEPELARSLTEAIRELGVPALEGWASTEGSD